MLSRACPQRASSAPRNMTELRSSRISECGISLRLIGLESMYTASPSRSTEQPRPRRMRIVVFTSRSVGTFKSSVSPGASTLAAMMGSTAFLAPWTVTLPDSRLPPAMCQTLISSPPNSRFRPYYAGGAGFVILPRASPRGRGLCRRSCPWRPAGRGSASFRSCPQASRGGAAAR